MPTLKRIINDYMYKITSILIIAIVMVVFFIQIQSERQNAYEEAVSTIHQIEQIMIENQKELETVEADYKRTCLLNAKVVSRLIESDPELLYDVQELKQLTLHLEIDEIHIFDENGVIFAGTHPQYYGYSMDAGEQISFFKPLLTDKSLEMVQEVEPNTVEKRLVQYSALWSKNGKYIVQVGMEPVKVEKATEKNELSYIFSLFRVNPNYVYYAIDEKTEAIIGSSDLNMMGLKAEEIGFSLEDIKYSQEGFVNNINGTNSYCVFQQSDTTHIGVVISLNYLYGELPFIMLMVFFGLMVIALGLVIAFNEHMKNTVVDKIKQINKTLTNISAGDLDESVEIRNSLELSELSNHINNMVQSLLNSNTKLTYVLKKIDLYVGTYEYDTELESVYFSEEIPQLFSMEEGEDAKLISNPAAFVKYKEGLMTAEIPGEDNTYKVGAKYIKLEEVHENGYTFGVVIDVTNDYAKRKELEAEIHIDPLTGLYTRKGIDVKMALLFENKEALGHYAVIMLEADRLLEVNDKYGHDSGDLYLQKIAKLITEFGIRNSIASRQNRGEFVLFIYGYESREELEKALELLVYIQSHSTVTLNDELMIPLEFSLGYCMSDEHEDMSYQQILREAGARMNTEKLYREQEAAKEL